MDFTNKQVELSRRLPYRVETIKTVFELLEDDTKAEALLETTAKLGIDPVEIAELVYEVKHKRLKYPKQIRKKKHTYITIPGSAVVITTLNRTGEKRKRKGLVMTAKQRADAKYREKIRQRKLGNASNLP